jgi:hypothetical protein
MATGSASASTTRTASVPDRPRASPVVLVVVLGAVNAIGPPSIDMYLPAFPGSRAAWARALRSSS